MMKSVVTQSFIPLIGTNPGVSQVTRVTLNTDTTFPGATYTMTLTESNGSMHVVSYVSNLYDGSSQILKGLLVAAETDADVYWQSVVKTFDPTGLTLDLSVNDEFSTDVIARRPPPPVPPPSPPPGGTGGAYWEMNPFPKIIVEQVVRGAYADLLQEWGQDSKAAAQEQTVPLETSISAEDFGPMPNPELTGQQRALSRYKI